MHPSPPRTDNQTDTRTDIQTDTRADTQGQPLPEVDFALVAYREDEVWYVEELPAERFADVGGLATELRRWPGDFGALGLVSVDEDFFVLLRVAGDRVRVLLSDVSAALEWEMARSALEALAIPVPDDDTDDDLDEDEVVPAGDLGIVADLGLPAQELGAWLDDPELYPDEVLGDIAHRLGFGALYDDVVGVVAP